MLTYHKQIDKRTTMKNQNRSAALGRPAMKLLGGGGATMLTYHKQIDKRTTMKNQNRSAALGRPAMKLLGGGGGGSTSLRSTNPRP